MKYRKKPVLVEAEQFFKVGDASITDTMPEPALLQVPRNCLSCGKPLKEHGWIETLEGGHIVCPGDWIITGVKGERYPCKPDIFDQTYEPVRPAPSSSILRKEATHD